MNYLIGNNYQMKDAINGMTRGVVTVLENQIDAENTAKARETTMMAKVATKIYIIFALIAFSGLQWIVSASYGKWHSGLWFFETGAEVRRLGDENNRQDNEINHLREKIGWRNETLLVYKAILEDRAALLEESKTVNPFRESFEFEEWSNPNLMVQTMFQNDAQKCIEWVMRQPNWEVCLSQKYVELVQRRALKPISVKNPMEKRKYFRGRKRF